MATGRPRGRPRTRRGPGRPPQADCLTRKADLRRRDEREQSGVRSTRGRGGRRRSQPPDSDPNDDPAANLDEVLSAVSEEENASSEGESEPEGHDIGVVDEPWNTPSGFEKVKEQSSEYFKRIKYHGHVCSVCGERRFDGKPCRARTSQRPRFANGVLDVSKTICIMLCLTTNEPYKIHESWPMMI